MVNFLQVGDVAPSFGALDPEGQSHTLEDFVGGWLVLYFYPRDNTPGCTTEALDFSERSEAFAQLGATIVGISPDSPASHQKFRAKQGLKILLLSDPERIVAQAYGVWGPKKFMGKESLGIIRSTFLLSPQSHISHIWHNVRVKNHAQQVLETLSTLLGGCG
jgi:peroxiredoxin Q/BCP